MEPGGQELREIGEAYRKRREALGLTQGQVAEGIDMEIKSVRRLELGERSSRRTINAIGAYLTRAEQAQAERLRRTNDGDTPRGTVREALRQATFAELHRALLDRYGDDIRATQAGVRIEVGTAPPEALNAPPRDIIDGPTDRYVKRSNPDHPNEGDHTA